MKEFQEKQVRFYFKLNDGSNLSLTYNLDPTSLRERWITQVKNKLNEKDHYYDFKISNKTKTDSEYLMRRLNRVIESINELYDDTLPLFKITSEIDRDILNYLHEEFEEYGARLEQYDPFLFPGGVGDHFNKELHDLWLRLNQWIHITETALIEDGTNFPNFSCLVNIHPIEIGKKLQDYDKLFLDTMFRWGELYLGYNTLGKDYLHTFVDNDVRVVTHNQVKVQEYFSPEIWLNFGPSYRNKKVQEMLFYDWYKSLPSSVKEAIPIDNLSKLALGRYYMGSLILDKRFLDFHPIVEDWYYNEEIQKRWNLEVFSKVESLTKIEIIEEINNV